VWLDYDPDILKFNRNWVVKIIMFKGVLPVYRKYFRFWRYDSALRKYNELLNKLKETTNKLNEIINKFREGVDDNIPTT